MNKFVTIFHQRVCKDHIPDDPTNYFVVAKKYCRVCHTILNEDISRYLDVDLETFPYDDLVIMKNQILIHSGIHLLLRKLQHMEIDL